MNEDQRLSPEERQFEAALTGLRPAEPSLNRDALLFRAGQASARRELRRWQGATALLMVGLGLSAWMHSAPVQPAGGFAGKDQVANRTWDPRLVDAYAEEARPGARPAYFTLRDEVLTRGIDALGSPRVVTVEGTEPAPSIERLERRHPSAGRVTALDTLRELFNPGVGL